MDFIRSTEPQPHPLRTKQILAAHPEARELMGNHPMSAFWIVLVVSAQTALAIALSHQPWWVIALSAYCLGALLNHAMWVMVHESAHNLIFKGTPANALIGIVANLPLFFPSAISFKKYHLYHHRYQGELSRDADLGWAFEGRLVGNSTWRKALYLAMFFIVQGVLRPIRVREVKPLCRWTVLNFVVEVAYLGSLTYFFGGGALFYIFMSMFFSVGLHPVGARWIQEHYVFQGEQETYSYYGPLNKINFNIGHHNEHHDLMMIPWPNLPKLRAMAPEFYDNLYYHTSYTKLLWQYLTRKDISPYSRVIREGRGDTKSSRNEAATSPQLATVGIPVA